MDLNQRDPDNRRDVIDLIDDENVIEILLNGVKMLPISKHKYPSVVVDTNILINSLDNIKTINDKVNIYVPKAVIEELANLYERDDDDMLLKRKASSALIYLLKRKTNRDPRLANLIVVESDNLNIKTTSNDDKIIYCALHLKKTLKKTIGLLTMDVILEIKAIACGINTFSIDDPDLTNVIKTCVPVYINQRDPENRCEIIDLLVDENFLINRWGFLVTLVDISNGEIPHRHKFRIHIPRKALKVLDLLKVCDGCDDCVDRKRVAAKINRYLLDEIRNKSPWIDIQAINCPLVKWIDQIETKSLFMLNEKCLCY